VTATSSPARPRRPGPLAAVVAAACASAFVALAVPVARDTAIPGDRRALVELHDALGTELDDVMVAIGDVTDLLPLTGVAVIAVAWELRRGRRRRATVVAVAVAVVWALNPVLKELVGRDRPDVRPLPEAVSRHGFPSGHAAHTAALAGVLALVTDAGRRRVAVLAAGGAVVALVGFSRLAAGVHYPTDVLAAWLWVAAWLAVLVPWARPAAGPAAPRRPPEHACRPAEEDT
jgi:undecaprenyl-diphosphatase